MTERSTLWNPTCKRFVAFMDIIGFKDMIFRKSHDEVKKTLESFQHAIGVVEREAQKRLALRGKETATPESVLGGSIVRPVFFSDSIIFVSSDDSLSSAYRLLWSTEYLVGYALVSGISIKGAIAYGEQTADFDKSIHFGKPLIDAYELQEELLLYGVALHHTMEQHLIDNGMMAQFEDSDLFKWPTPMQAGKISHYLVDWSQYRPASRKPEAITSGLYRTVSGSSRRYVDNTLEFIDWLAKRKPEILQSVPRAINKV